ARRVLASPGTPSSSTWPRTSSAITRRSTTASCPTTARATSARSRAMTLCAAAICDAAAVESSVVMNRNANMPPVTAPKKKWAQTFLRRPGAVTRIVEAVEPQPDELIVEIGPGEGVLTERLAGLPNELTAVEIDPDLAARLRARFGGRVEVVNADATAF